MAKLLMTKIIISVTAMISAAVLAEVRDPFAAALNTSDYLLYGLTAGCDVFFAANFTGTERAGDPCSSGSKLDKLFTGGSSGQKCESAFITPIKNAAGKLKLLVLMPQSRDKNVVYIHDFKRPAIGEEIARIPYFTCEAEGDMTFVSPDGSTCQYIQGLPTTLEFIDWAYQRVYGTDARPYYSDLEKFHYLVQDLTTITVHSFSLSAAGELIQTDADRENPVKWTKPVGNSGIGDVMEMLVDHAANRAYVRYRNNIHRIAVTPTDIATNGTILPHPDRNETQMEDFSPYGIKKRHIINGQMVAAHWDWAWQKMGIATKPIRPVLTGGESGEVTTCIGHFNPAAGVNAQMSALIGALYQKVMAEQ